jgi:glycosyltransferase involved in cell wall biosynthesis
MDLLVKLVTAPLKPFDALICTSNAVLKHVENVFEHQEAYLRMIHGANRFVRPILPIIPLGVHSECFSSLRLPQSAIEARQFFGISDEAIVILYVGRLSFHAKAHPLPMYDAASRAQALTRKEVVIIECGWYANIHIKEAFDSAADLIAPNLKRIYVDGRRPVDRDRAWAAADIFCSLADNVQETFGITPIEAMAAGLPVVVSDWDGYRETVEHGVQGFRIKTTIPYPGLGKDLADLFAVEALNYDRYCGYTSSFVSVDIEQLIKTFELLFNDRELREQLGRNGQLRVAEKYDWSGIISQYEQLWIEQHRIMSGMRRTSLTHTINPARLDPFDAFKHYATRAIDPKDWVAPRNGLNSSFIDEYRKREQLAIVKFSQPVTLSSKEIISLLQTMPPSGTSLEKLAQSAPIESKPMVFRTIVWLAKIGILEISQKTEE